MPMPMKPLAVVLGDVDPETAVTFASQSPLLRNHVTVVTVRYNTLYVTVKLVVDVRVTCIDVGWRLGERVGDDVEVGFPVALVGAAVEGRKLEGANVVVGTVGTLVVVGRNVVGFVGTGVGLLEGLRVGRNVGVFEGLHVGTSVGTCVGTCVGPWEGFSVGRCDGRAVVPGFEVGFPVDAKRRVGLADVGAGCLAGCLVGARVGGAGGGGSKVGVHVGEGCPIPNATWYTP